MSNSSSPFLQVSLLCTIIPRETPSGCDFKARVSGVCGHAYTDHNIVDLVLGAICLNIFLLLIK